MHLKQPTHIFKYKDILVSSQYYIEEYNTALDCVPYTAVIHYLPTDKGLFSQCLDKLLTGGIAKPYLTSYMGGLVDVKLNNGRCSVDDRGIFYYFCTSRKSSECGTERRVSDRLAGISLRSVYQC